MLNKNCTIIVCLTLLYFGCENRKATLLPEINTLELISEQEIGITTLYVYKIKGDLEINELYDFPQKVYPVEEKLVTKWHPITELEKSDFQEFVNVEVAHNETIEMLLKHLETDDFLLSIVYDKNRKPMGVEGYSIYDWIDLYFLDLAQKEITHISYGKF